MRNFNTKLYFSFIGLLAFFLASLNAQLFAQEKHQTEAAPHHKIITKKKIVTENGETKVIERVIDGSEEGIDLEDIEDHIEKIEIIRHGTPGNEEHEVIIQSSGENGEMTIEVISDDEDVRIKGIGKCEGPKVICITGEGDHPGMFHINRGMNHPGTHNLKVVTLQPGEALPDDIVKQVAEMGLDVEAVKQQVDAAERMVYISKKGETPAFVEVDGEEPESLKGFMLHNNTEGMHFLPEMPEGLNWQSKDGNAFFFNPENNFNFDYDFDFDFNKEDLDNHFNFEFDGEVPAELKKKLEEHNVWIDKLQDGQIKIVTPDGEQIIELDVEHGEGENHFFKLNSEGQFEGFQNIENLEDIDIDIDIPGLESLEKFEDLNFFKTWNWGAGCDDGSAAKEEKPFLGVLLGENSEKGIFIDDVVEGSAAEEAGLQAGDIITMINETTVTNADELIDAIQGQKVGDQITVRYTREGNVATATATLKGKVNKIIGKGRNHFEHKAPRPEPHLFRDRSWFRQEVDCDKLCNSPFLGVLIEDADENTGAHVTNIFEATGAEKAGLLEGDVIMSINEEAMNNIDGVIKKILSYKPGDVVKVGYVRDGQKLTTNATLGTKANSGAYNPCDCETLELKQPVEHQEIIILKEQAEDIVTEEATPEAVEIPSQNQAPAEQRTLQLRAFSLFPNPNNGNFTISFRAEKLDPITISVVDLSGREIYREEVPDFRGSYYQDINISQNSGGVYFLNIIQGNEIWTERFVYSNE